VRPSTAVWVLGGVALYGIVTFVGFNAAAASLDQCRPNCTSEQNERSSNEYFAGEVSWVVGLLAAGVAIYLAIAAPSAASRHGSGWPMVTRF
jgi:hypothetical protein